MISRLERNKRAKSLGASVAGIGKWCLVKHIDNRIHLGKSKTLSKTFPTRRERLIDSIFSVVPQADDEPVMFHNQVLFPRLGGVKIFGGMRKSENPVLIVIIMGSRPGNLIFPNY